MANISANNFLQKHQNNYSCLLCDFTCSNKYNFNQHLLTAKHKKMMMTNISSSQKMQKKMAGKIKEGTELRSSAAAKRPSPGREAPR